eukprot:m.12000 g.12000  ORF g.12000 m.12000 type:complete len:432 (-) comp7100_c1_seq2:126-1421(-)
MIKASGSKVEMTIIPHVQQPQESMETMTQNTMQKISDARSRAQGMIQTDEIRKAEAEKQAEEERKRLREESLQHAEKIRQQRIQEQFDHDRTIIEDNLKDAIEELELTKKKVSSAREMAQAHATKSEFESFHTMLAGIRDSELERLEAEHSAPLPDEPNDRIVEELRRKMQRAVVEQEIYDVQAAEWSRFANDCQKRREEEKKTDNDLFERTKVARDRDMEFLQKKKERMERLMKAAEEKRIKEIEEVRQREKERREQREIEMQKRAEKAEALARKRELEKEEERLREEQRAKFEAERQSTLAMQQKEEELRLKKMREYQEKGAQAMKQRMGTPINAKSPQKRANPSHPMVCTDGTEEDNESEVNVFSVYLILLLIVNLFRVILIAVRCGNAFMLLLLFLCCCCCLQIALMQKNANGVRIPLVNGMQNTNM